MANNICFSSSIIRFVVFKKKDSHRLLRNFPATGVGRMGGHRRTLLHPCGPVAFIRDLSSEFPGVELPQLSE